MLRSHLIGSAIIFIIFSANIYSVGHVSHPEYTGPIEEYREFLTADELHKTCNGIALPNYQFTSKPYDYYQSSRRKQKELKDFLKEYCAGYIFANAEAHDSSIAKGGWSYCLPNKITKRNIQDTVLEYISAHNEEMQHTAVSVIAHALNNAFPCTSETHKNKYEKYSVEEFYKSCQAGNEGFCIGYIQGIADAYDNWETGIDKKFCGVGYGLARLVLLRFIILVKATNIEDDYIPALRTMTIIIRDANLDQDKCIDRGLGPLQFLCHSADSGDTNAQYKLGLYFDYGIEGLPKDPMRAYVWYEIAATHGDHKPSASRVLQLHNVLTREQTMQAKQLVEDWKPGWCEMDISTLTSDVE
ncbi:MAG: sel1 repeat family protein [Gammaproteobacteria bacterium]|nr:MAG: sel1 repeat family protein [Gammaproteobacteria bacterium]